MIQMKEIPLSVTIQRKARSGHMWACVCLHIWILTYLQWDWHQKSKRKQIGWGTTTTHVYNAWYPIKALQMYIIHLQFAASRWWKWWSCSKQAITTEFIDDTCCIYTTTWFWLNLIFEGSSNMVALGSKFRADDEEEEGSLGWLFTANQGCWWLSFYLPMYQVCVPITYKCTIW